MPEYLTDEQKQYLDLDTALSRVRGNSALYGKLLKMFLASEEFAAFDQAIDAGDFARACDIIHSIKGLTGNLSLKALFELSTTLNQQLKDGAPDADTLVKYQDVYEKTKDTVNEFLARSSN